jgi:hypothetical protein
VCWQAGPWPLTLTLVGNATCCEQAVCCSVYRCYSVTAMLSPYTHISEPSQLMPQRAHCLEAASNGCAGTRTALPGMSGSNIPLPRRQVMASSGQQQGLSWCYSYRAWQGLGWCYSYRIWQGLNWCYSCRTWQGLSRCYSYTAAAAGKGCVATSAAASTSLQARFEDHHICTESVLPSKVSTNARTYVVGTECSED